MWCLQSPVQPPSVVQRSAPHPKVHFATRYVASCCATLRENSGYLACSSGRSTAAGGAHACGATASPAAVRGRAPSMPAQALLCRPHHRPRGAAAVASAVPQVESRQTLARHPRRQQHELPQQQHDRPHHHSKQQEQQQEQLPRAPDRPGGGRGGAAPEPAAAACVRRRATPRPPEGLAPAQLPQHVAIIMDGNSRYAASHGWHLSAGHEAGVAALRRAVHAAGQWGVRALTVYAFSEENWAREVAEVAFLMGLFERALGAELPALVEAGVRLRFVGGLERLPDGLQRCIASAEAATADGGGLLLTVAVSYSAQADIASAARSLAADVAAGRMLPADVTPAALASRLGTAEAGPVDLLIRTSGTHRLSNFLLFECAYAELWFEPVLWPAFGEEHFERALRAFAARERRFGGRLAGAARQGGKRGGDAGRGGPIGAR